MTIVRSESSSHLGELHRVESSSTGSVSTVGLAEATARRSIAEQKPRCSSSKLVRRTAALSGSSLRRRDRSSLLFGLVPHLVRTSISQPVCAWASSSAVLAGPLGLRACRDCLN